MPTFTQIASDNFTRANENPLNTANWSIQNGYVALQVVSNFCEPTSTATGGMELYTGAVFAADQYSSITLHTLISTSIAAPVIRGQGANPAVNTQYFALVSGPFGATATIKLFKKVAGIPTQLGSTFTGTVSQGDVITLYAQGTSLTVTQNGTTVIGPITDNAITSGLPGCFAQDTAATTNVSISLWTGGNVGVPGPSFASLPSGGGVLAADSFIRPNVTGTAYNGNWLQPNSTDALLQLLGNVMCPGTANVSCAGIYVNVTSGPTSTTGGLPAGAMFAADQWSSAQLNAAAPTDTYGLILRSDQGNATQTYYIFFLTGTGSSVTAKIRKYVSGTQTDLTSGTVTSNIGSHLLFTVHGTTLTAFVDGVQVLQTTDSAIASGSPGIQMNGGTNTVGLSMWRGGTFNTTGPLVVFMGDSIISRWNLAQQFPGKQYCNCGIGSQASAAILARFNLETVSQAPIAVVIEGGRNGFQNGTENVSQTTANMAAMGAAAVAAGIKVIYTDTIASGNAGDIPALGTDIDALNVNVNTFTNGVVSNWNLAIDFQTIPTTVIPANYIADLIHPNTTGYALIAPVASASITAALSGSGGGGMGYGYDFSF